MVEEMNKNINGDFKITLFMIIIVLTAFELLNSFNERITKNEKAKYTPPRKPKAIIAIHSKYIVNLCPLFLLK
jgi:hypothetical protein